MNVRSSHDRKQNCFVYRMHCVAFKLLCLTNELCYVWNLVTIQVTISYVVRNVIFNCCVPLCCKSGLGRLTRAGWRKDHLSQPSTTDPKNFRCFPCCFDTLTVTEIMCFDLLSFFILLIFVLGLANKTSTVDESPTFQITERAKGPFRVAAGQSF